TLGGSVSEVKKDVDSGIGLSLDGKQFVFVRSNPDQGEDQLLVANEQTGEESQLAARKFTQHFSVVAAPPWSRDCSLVAAVTQTADENGFYLQLDGFNPSTREETRLGTRRWLEINAIDW